MTGNDAQDYNIAAIRQLLLAAFTPEDLRRFCHDRPDFRMVVRRFGPGHGHDDMVDELITYCENYLLFPELLTQLKRHNPRQYARFIEPEFALSASDRDILTIASPISLQLVRVPAGEFLMGSVMARDKDAQEVELPPHPVDVLDTRRQIIGKKRSKNPAGAHTTIQWSMSLGSMRLRSVSG
jgi:hypothetical protein